MGYHLERPRGEQGDMLYVKLRESLLKLAKECGGKCVALQIVGFAGLHEYPNSKPNPYDHFNLFKIITTHDIPVIQATDIPSAVSQAKQQDLRVIAAFTSFVPGFKEDLVMLSEALVAGGVLSVQTNNAMERSYLRNNPAGLAFIMSETWTGSIATGLGLPQLQIISQKAA